MSFEERLVRDALFTAKSGDEKSKIVMNLTEIIPAQIKENANVMYQKLLKINAKNSEIPAMPVVDSVKTKRVETEAITENSPVKFNVDGKDILAKNSKTKKNEKKGTEKANPFMSESLRLCSLLYSWPTKKKRPTELRQCEALIIMLPVTPYWFIQSPSTTNPIWLIE